MRAMRIMVLFDLPTGSAKERRAYSDFRKYLRNDGFTMEQYSVYSRVTLGRDTLQAHIERLKGNLPPEGSVTVITMTEKQYEDRMILLGNESQQNHANDYGAQLTLVF